jgi:hypothetical protein
MAKSFNAGYSGPVTRDTLTSTKTRSTNTKRKRATLAPYERPKYYHHLTAQDQDQY